MASTKGVGPQIAEARRAAGLTQEALATSMGLSTRAIQSWELGLRHPRGYEVQLSLCKALGISVGELYADTDSKEAA